MNRVELDRSLFNYRGQFYPTDHVLAMVPDEHSAREAARDIVSKGYSPDVQVVPPDTLMHDLAATAAEFDEPMPSPGTEAATARHFVDLARQGQWGLLIHCKRSVRDEGLVRLLESHGSSFAERYRLLVIEDLVGQND